MSALGRFVGTAGVLRTATPTFAAWLLAVTLVLSGLTIFLALCLEPIVEGLGG